MSLFGKKNLSKDIQRCFQKTKGRFFSILCLVALGTFALVGLQVAGPDMRKTAENYFNSLNLADMSVIGDYGIDEANIRAISNITGAEKIEYGYLKDVVVSKSDISIRIFSMTDTISRYEIVEGRLPDTKDEIALASFLKEEGYEVGGTITLLEKEDMTGETILQNHEPTIVGFVNSPELVNIINMGQSTAGSGELKGFGVVTKEAFDSDVYMIARISYADTKGVDPYSQEYTDLITEHKNDLEKKLSNQPAVRLHSIKTEYSKKIEDAKIEIADGKQELADALKELETGDKKLAYAKTKYKQGKQDYADAKSSAEEQLAAAAKQIEAAKTQIAAAEKQLQPQVDQLNASKAALATAKQSLDSGWATYNGYQSLKNQKTALDAEETQVNSAIAATGKTIAELRADYSTFASIVDAYDTYQTHLAQYNAAAQQFQGMDDAQAAALKTQLDAAQTQYDSDKATCDAAETQLKAAQAQLDQSKKDLATSEAAYTTKKAETYAKLKEAKQELNSAAQKIEDAEAELNEKWDEYNEKKPQAEQDIADAEDKVTKGERALARLEQPVYALDTRRETPGSEGYTTYASVSEIVDSLADIFPFFLYFVAALVTLTTMTRFVSEERMNSGTLKALGYNNADIMKKFILYGLVAGLVGDVIGIITGHTIIPLIVYNAYGASFTYPKIELHFYPGISAISVIFALLCTVLPVCGVAVKNLSKKPSSLLLPKPPAAGSKILLEKIHFLWNRLSFTHKVTARNLFRYKGRMLMTIFGVCGSVTLIFTGFSVQHSISGIKDRQFGAILTYDMIVAENDSLFDDEKSEIRELLTSDAVDKSVAIYYEEVTKTAGKNNDDQPIKLIVPAKAEDLPDYIALFERTSGEPISLSDDGCVITERFARLIDADIGDTFEYQDEFKNRITVKISGICEMYAGHFIFMSKDYYEQVTAQNLAENAHLVVLKDHSQENVKDISSKFMELDAVQGVVQNTTLISVLDTIVEALNSIMDILILIAILLAVVIMYNLTNINVCERIRELSTIKVLGFYDNEVMMYIYRETIILSVIGIIAGYGFGYLLFHYIIEVVPPDEVMFNPALGPTAFILPVIVIAGITTLLGFVINKKLRNVNMLEALKSVD